MGNWRGKEHLQKLKDKYGDTVNDNDEDETDSSDEEEDEDAEELTPEIEKDFFATLSSLKRKDPSIYDGTTSFFREKTSDSVKSKESKNQRVTIADMERKVILEKGGKFDEIGDGIDETVETPTYNEEMKELKDSFKTALQEDNESDDEDGFLTKRKRTVKEEEQEDEDYKKWLAGQKTAVDD